MVFLLRHPHIEDTFVWGIFSVDVPFVYCRAETATRHYPNAPRGDKRDTSIVTKFQAPQGSGDNHRNPPAGTFSFSNAGKYWENVTILAIVSWSYFILQVVKLKLEALWGGNLKNGTQQRLLCMTKPSWCYSLCRIRILKYERSRKKSHAAYSPNSSEISKDLKAIEFLWKIYLHQKISWAPETDSISCF